MNYTDIQLKQALAKMLLDKLISYHITCPPCPSIKYEGLDDWKLCWKDGQEPFYNRVLDTELLHLCWLVEETLDNREKDVYTDYLVMETDDLGIPDWDTTHATWQQRVQSLCKVKGIKI